ncbi:hypothetical protein KDX16_32120 [Burkholderia vietnamiensis]|jgi:hypothetical protein|uniref:Uncharacterized protein n=3 Tax=Burkholderia cepacia complex TaxID=87882 RepID=A0A228HLS1_9BURK|nr:MULTISPECIES: hypothetical protein [Burkholderia]OXI31091.1 hypothetical protein CFB84_42610 [Burkholderia aenigmatica]HDR9758738.1 hypothetical protein [Burkholderia cepacia ATCC 25416]MBR7920445.1 hypothetical protein [Burkholderia vietnamiensis]MBR8054807.1 hypothetical protein [Burkholderia vietnamiensis]HDR9794004.1 hypothetical protein [Burkholderia cepacia ATCC 25416]
MMLERAFDAPAQIDGAVVAEGVAPDKSAMPDHSELTLGLAEKAFAIIGADTFTVSARLSVDDPRTLRNFGLLESMLLMAYNDGKADALHDRGGAVGDAMSSEEHEHFDAMAAEVEGDLKAEGAKIYRITHHYDIGNQDVYVEHPTGDVDGKQVALYLWFKAWDWFGSSVLISNLGIASVMVAFYGFRHCAAHPFSTTVDLYSDAEGLPGYDALMSDASLHREGLRDAMAPHVVGSAG